MLSFSFAPYPTRFLAFISLIPLFWLIDEAKKPFIYGYLFGVGLGAGQVWWLLSQTFPLFPLIRFLLVVGVILLSGFLGLFPGLFASLTKRIGLWAAPLIWPAVEMIRELTDLAFPWELLGYSLTPWPVLTQTASLWGVYGLGALIVLVNLALYQLLKNLRDSRKALVWGGVLAGTFVFMLGFGLIRLGTAKPEKAFRVALVQPNVPTVLKGSRNLYDSLITAMLDQTRDAARFKPDLILYPETATLVDLTKPTPFTAPYLELVDSMNVYLATGIPHSLRDKGRHRFANSATLVHRDGSLDSLYIKIRLAPFGETIPFENVLPFLGKIDVQGGHHYRGKDYVVYRDAPQPFSFLICYEAIFPGLTRNFVHRGARMLAAVTNDVWFGQLQGPAQHAEMAVMRTVENGVPMIRAANNGISMIVDPYGRVLASSQLLVKTIVAGDVPRPVGPTAYTRFGFLFPYAASGFVLVMLVTRLVQRGVRRKREPRKARDSLQRSSRKVRRDRPSPRA